MGKKGRRTSQSSSEQNGPGTTKIPARVKRKLDDAVDQLFQMCTTGSQDWAQFVKIYEMLQKIRALEKDYVLPPNSREEHFDKLLTWLSEEGASWKSLKIHQFSVGGFGLSAECSIEEGEQWLTIPRKVMLTSETARKSKLGVIAETDTILQHMPNVLLALHLLNERCEEKSFWTPYIKTLPDEYDTPMYFTLEELNELKGSPVLDEAVKHCRNIARQYAYFYRLFKTHHAGSRSDQDLPMKEFFTYDSYRWAVSAVMTRQNPIPSTDGSSELLALVPLWDMCNHSSGKLTTDYNLEKDQLESYSFQAVSPGDQIFIFYGLRSNAELFVHSGFVYADNEHDSVAMKLELRKSDPLYSRKEELLNKLGISSSTSFRIRRGASPIDGSVLAFHRVSAMNEETLNKCCVDDHLQTLTEVACHLDGNMEQLCWKMLNTRLSHMVNTYPTSLEADELLLSEGKTNGRTTLAVRLRVAEKKLLKSALNYVSEWQGTI